MFPRASLWVAFAGRMREGLGTAAAGKRGDPKGPPLLNPGFPPLQPWSLGRGGVRWQQEVSPPGFFFSPKLAEGRDWQW